MTFEISVGISFFLSDCFLNIVTFKIYHALLNDRLISRWKLFYLAANVIPSLEKAIHQRSQILTGLQGPLRGGEREGRKGKKKEKRQKRWKKTPSFEVNLWLRRTSPQHHRQPIHSVSSSYLITINRRRRPPRRWSVWATADRRLQDAGCILHWCCCCCCTDAAVCVEMVSPSSFVSDQWMNRRMRLIARNAGAPCPP